MGGPVDSQVVEPGEVDVLVINHHGPDGCPVDQLAPAQFGHDSHECVPLA
jgi:hypothetical protein